MICFVALPRGSARPDKSGLASPRAAGSPAGQPGWGALSAATRFAGWLTLESLRLCDGYTLEDLIIEVIRPLSLSDHLLGPEVSQNLDPRRRGARTTSSDRIFFKGWIVVV